MDLDITIARSDGKCTICREAIMAGDEIVWLKPSRLALLNALGLSLKVFRRAHIKCLPVVLDEQYRAVIAESTKFLLDRTDPEWPEDGIGYNRGDAGFARRFLDLDCPDVGLHTMALRLRKYLDTQLGGADTEIGKLVTEAIEAGKKARQALLARLRCQRETPTQIAACGASIQDAAKLEGRRLRGVVAVSSGATKGNVLIRMDHPRDNATHATIKDQLRAAGAKWSGADLGWNISTTGLALIWGDVFTEASVQVTESSRSKLAAVAEQIASGDLVLRKPGQVLVATNGRTELKVEIDSPWTNPRHADLKDQLKGLSAGWDKVAGAWWIGANRLVSNYDQLFGSDSGLDPDSVVVTPAAQQQLEDVLNREMLSGAASLEDAGVNTDLVTRLVSELPEGLEPYPFQLAGVAFIDAAGGRALISDQMGLGKTIQAILWLLLHPEARPAVLVVPAVVSTNWVDELNRWAPGERVQRIKTGKQKLDPDATVLVITYDLARRRVEELKNLKPQVVLFDECHLIKNFKAKRTQAMLELVEKTDPKAVIGLSGTPILNRPVEFFTMLKMLRPADYRSWTAFVTRYCDAYQDRYGWQIGGASNTEELSERLRDTMVRRTKAQVLQELPAKTRQRCKVELPRKEINRLKRTVTAMVEDGGPGCHLAAMTWERHETGLLKTKAALQWIEAHAEQDEPLLVFAHHQDVLNVLQDGCRKLKLRVGRIDQNASADKRGVLVKSFQAGNLDVMLLGIESGGVGITLTAAANVLFVERAWTPSAEEQAEDRTHRIGQELPVTARYLMADGTIDNYIAELIEQKRLVIQAILDGKAPTQESLDIRSDLLQLWLQHHGLAVGQKHKPRDNKGARP